MKFNTKTVASIVVGILILSVIAPLGIMVVSGDVATIPTGTWENTTDLPGTTVDGGDTTDRERFDAIHHNDTVYLGGGFFRGSDQDETPEFHKFNRSNESYTQLANMPKGIQQFEMVSSEKYVWVIGGRDTGTLDDGENILWRYNPRTDSWDTQTNIPIDIYQHRAVHHNGNIYVFGGRNNSGDTLSSVYKYDISSDTWTTVSSMPNPRRNHGTVVIDNTVYIMGGYNGTSRVDSVYKYDISNDSYTQVSNLPSEIDHFGAGSANGKIFVFGGYDNNGYRDITYIYHPSNDTWQTGNSMTVAKARFGDASDGEFLYSFGGDEGGDESRNAQVYHVGDFISSFTLSGYVENAENESVNNALVEITDGLGNTINDTRTNESGYYEMAVVEGTYTVIASKNNYNTSEKVVDLDSDKTQNFTLEEKYQVTVELRTDTVLDPGETVSYTVYLQNGSNFREDITDKANVTSGNISVLTVDLNNHDLVAKSGVNNTVIVSAEYQGTYDNVTIFVGEKTFENIIIDDPGGGGVEGVTGGDLDGNETVVIPPPYWPSIVWENKALQWLFISLSIGAVAGWTLKNPFGALGATEFMLIVGWVTNWIGDGFILSSFFATVFLGMIVAQMRQGAPQMEVK